MRWLAQLARRLAGDATLADDACQEVWSAWSFGEEAGPTRRPLLARALRRALWFSRRSDNRRKARERAAVPPEEPAAAAAELVAKAEDRRRAWDALLVLAEPFRSTLLLRFDENLPPSEIAERLGVPLPHV